jgi:hypothetical protein
MANLQNCLLAVQSWMANNKLKLNPDKTEFILIVTKHNRDQLSPLFPTNILESNLKPVGKVRYLGVIFDLDLSFSQHISSIIKSCYCKIKRLYARIRPLLSHSDAISLANTLVGSRLER